jgi:hypothetical protein
MHLLMTRVSLLDAAHAPAFRICLMAMRGAARAKPYLSRKVI